MAQVILLTEQFLKENSVINENTDMKVLRPTIILVQDKYMHPLLGTALRDDLLAQVTADNTLASNPTYKTLLDQYITPVLLHWTLYESPIPLTYKYMNKAVMKKTSDNAQPATMPDLMVLMDRHKDNAQWYSERLTLYLLANAPTLFPLYQNPGSTIDTIVPSQRNFSKGMYLGLPLGHSRYVPPDFEKLYQGNIPWRNDADV